jgi:hypothetical protein
MPLWTPPWPLIDHCYFPRMFHEHFVLTRPLLPPLRQQPVDNCGCPTPCRAWMDPRPAGEVTLVRPGHGSWQVGERCREATGRTLRPYLLNVIEGLTGSAEVTRLARLSRHPAGGADDTGVSRHSGPRRSDNQSFPVRSHRSSGVIEPVSPERGSPSWYPRDAP